MLKRRNCGGTSTKAFGYEDTESFPKPLGHKLSGGKAELAVYVSLATARAERKNCEVIFVSLRAGKGETH